MVMVGSGRRGSWWKKGAQRAVGGGWVFVVLEAGRQARNKFSFEMD